MKPRISLLGMLLVVCLATQADRATAQTQATSAVASLDSSFFSTYKWRSIGPSRGGRSIAVSGVKGRRNEAYFGATGGGLWKTIDSGMNWTPVTDGQINSSSVGAVAVSESNPDIVFIGMGESCIRGNIMPGDGIYKSVDAGKTWTHIGFENSDAISKIRIHPTNPDIVLVADFGRYGVPSDERGVFKSVDGGKTWKKVLFRDNKTGAVDISIDRKNPRIMYAALWEAYRVEYQMSSGGPGSGLFKSTDGGDTWTEITRSPGLPSGVVGKIGVAVSGADSNRVYALIENENGGLYVSDDTGANWKLVNDGRNVRQRAFYYTHIFADPGNKDVVYMLNTAAFRSTDGGKTLLQIGQGTHGDHHDMWIDPDDSEHLMDANDGGGAISYNISSRQRTWSRQEFPTGQFYHATTTAHLPFHVCGAQQDNTTMCVPSDTGDGGRGAVAGGGRFVPVSPYQVGGGEPGYIAADPKDPDIFYAGANNGSFLTRLNRRTNELKEVGAYPRFFSGETSAEVKERWQWTYPIIFSYVQPNVLYTSSQRIWKSTDEGQTWQAISGDLSRHDPKTMQESGGPITHDMNSPEIYGTVFSLAPGKTDVNIIWSGSDDGVVQLTRDGGKTWTNFTPSGMPDFGRVSQIDTSAFDSGSAYVAVKKMLLGDKSPYLFRTHDFGRTWTKIVNGIGASDFTHTIREDKTRRGLLYAGTEHGFYISYDDGDHWQSLRLNLPDTQVSDIWVEANDLAISTMGRGFYVLDDVAALRQYTPGLSTDALLLKPATAVRSVSTASIGYWLKAPPKTLTLEILDNRGQVVRTFSGTPPETAAPGGTAAPAGDEGSPRPPTGVPMVAGLNRFSWDLTAQPIVSFPGMILWGGTQNGPAVIPGSYQVRLTVDGRPLTQSFDVKKHPQRDITDADLQVQYDIAMQIRDKVNEANNAVIQIRRIKQATTDRAGRSNDTDLKSTADRLTRNLSAVEEDIYQVRNRSNQDPLNFPIKTNNRLASLLRVVETGDGKPTSNVVPIFNDLKLELKTETDRLQQILDTDLPALNRILQRLGLEAIN
jgi:photosystem II stability/assembly factor-like uncharacterized protein